MADTSADDDAALKAYNLKARPFQGIDESLSTEYLVPDAPWGMAVYRTAYSSRDYDSDAAWQRMMVELEDGLESLDRPSRKHLIPRHRMMTFDDRATLEGSSVDDVRTRFSRWATEELRRNLRKGANEVIKDETYAKFLGARYNYCLVVDEICLESLDKHWTPVVKLVWRWWSAPTEAEVAEWADAEEDDEPLPWEGGLTNDDQEDVGWMYLYACEWVETYNNLQRSSSWYVEYSRPPLPSLEDNFDRAPGFWRRQGKGGNEAS